MTTDLASPDADAAGTRTLEGLQIGRGQLREPRGAAGLDEEHAHVVVAVHDGGQPLQRGNRDPQRVAYLPQLRIRTGKSRNAEVGVKGLPSNQGQKLLAHWEDCCDDQYHLTTRRQGEASIPMKLPAMLQSQSLHSRPHSLQPTCK